MNTSNTFFLLNESKTFLFPKNTVFKNQSNIVNKRISSQDPIYGFIENIDHEGDDIYLKDETITLETNESFKIESKGRVEVPVDNITVKYRDPLNEITNSHNGNSNSEQLKTIPVTIPVAEEEGQRTPVLDYFGFGEGLLNRTVKRVRKNIRSRLTSSSKRSSQPNLGSLSTVPIQYKPHPEDCFARLIAPPSGSYITYNENFTTMTNILLLQNESPDLTEFRVHTGNTVFELSPGYYLENNSNNTVHIPVKSVICGTTEIQQLIRNNNQNQSL